MKPRYERFVELANQGARDLGYKDLGAYWRSNYDMPADAFAAELDRLWTQVRPLYEALHAHVRASLAKAYPGKVPEKRPRSPRTSSATSGPSSGATSIPSWACLPPAPATTSPSC